MGSEQEARETVDRMLAAAAGWAIDLEPVDRAALAEWCCVNSGDAEVPPLSQGL